MDIRLIGDYVRITFGSPHSLWTEKRNVENTYGLPLMAETGNETELKNDSVYI